jgi:hypothetical protein
MQTYKNDLTQWIAKCSQVLESNLPDKNILAKLQFRYTCPAKEKGTYLPQWLWDSCFHAIVYRWFDPKMAWEEVQSLLVHQVKSGDDAGMVPHMAYLAENRNISDQELFKNQNRSILTQPPLLAIAALEVHKVNPNRDVLQKMYMPLKNYHQWFDRRRDPENDHLVAIIHPWESGWDVSQRWDHFMGYNQSGPGLLTALAKKRKELIDLIIKYECNATKLATVPNGFYVKPVDFNAIRAADFDALAGIAQIIGESETEVLRLKKRALRIREAIQKKMIFEKGGRLFAHDLPVAGKKMRSSESAAKFVLLFGKCVSERQSKLLRNELTGKIGSYKARYSAPTTPTDNPSFDGNEYWRGNVWLPVNWLIWKGLHTYGFVNEAGKLSRNSIDLVEKSGYREFFNPLTGKGGKNNGIDCPQNQSWSTIILDMIMTSISNES